MDRTNVHPEDMPKESGLKLDEAINNPETKGYVVEYRLRHKKGNYIHVKDTAKILRHNHFTHIIGGVRDITERKQLQQKLEEYAKQLEDAS